MRTFFWIPLLTTGCLTLDPLMPFFDPVHCSDVTEQTCDPEHPDWDEKDDPIWGRACLPCDEPYDWNAEHPWRESTLDGDYTSVRGIPDAHLERLALTVENGEDLDVYFVSSHGEVPALANTTIVYNHGNYVGMEHYLPRIRFFYELGYNVYVWDYRGYGKSVPVDPPTLPQMMSDTKDAFRQAESLVPDTGKMIIYGMSIGGMAAGEMAARFDGCALMLEAAYNSVTAKIESNTSLSLPGSFLTSGLAENDAKLRNTKTPTLIMHSENDMAVSIDDARRLFRKLPDSLPKEMVVLQNADHAIGGDVGGFPEQGLTAYGEVMMSFLTDNAPGCLAEE